MGSTETSNFLESSEVNSKLDTLNYKTDTLNAILKKHGYSRLQQEWKMKQLNSFMADVAKERQELDDIVSTAIKFLNKKIGLREDKNNSEVIFIGKECFFSLEQKLNRLKNVVNIIKLKSNAIINNIKLMKKNWDFIF